MSTKSNVAVGAAAVLSAAAVAVGTMSSATEQIYGSYDIVRHNEYMSEIRLDIPSEFTPDICELKLNDLDIEKALLPYGTFKVHPMVVTEPEYLSLDLYVVGDKAATAEFQPGGVLCITVDKKYLPEDDTETFENNEEEINNAETE